MHQRIITRGDWIKELICCVYCLGNFAYKVIENKLSRALLHLNI